MTVNYQNPASVDLVLDSEQIATDAVTGKPLIREFVIPEESISGFSPQTGIQTLLEEIVSELKVIRVLLETDVPPGLADEMDEAQDQTGRGDSTEEGIEDQ
jgi:hypothetical protein